MLERLDDLLVLLRSFQSDTINEFARRGLRDISAGHWLIGAEVFGALVAGVDAVTPVRWLFYAFLDVGVGQQCCLSCVYMLLLNRGCRSSLVHGGVVHWVGR